MKRNTCRVAPQVMNLTRECAQQSMLTNEDEADYCNAWEEKTELTKELPSCLMPEFKYRTAEELDGFLIMADLDSYSGGGYMVKVKGQSKEIRGNLVKLQQQRWINNQTRAVILEFATYNVNINVFVVITITAEFLPGEDDSLYNCRCHQAEASDHTGDWIRSDCSYLSLGEALLYMLSCFSFVSLLSTLHFERLERYL